MLRTLSRWSHGRRTLRANLRVGLPSGSVPAVSDRGGAVYNCPPNSPPPRPFL